MIVKQRDFYRLQCNECGYIPEQTFTDPDAAVHHAHYWKWSTRRDEVYGWEDLCPSCRLNHWKERLEAINQERSKV